MALRHWVEGRDRNGRLLYSWQGTQLVSMQSNTECGRIFAGEASAVCRCSYNSANGLPLTGDRKTTLPAPFAAVSKNAGLGMGRPVWGHQGAIRSTFGGSIRHRRGKPGLSSPGWSGHVLLALDRVRVSI